MGATLPLAGRVDLSGAKVGVGVHTKIVARNPHPALVRFAYSRHPPRKGEGENHPIRIGHLRRWRLPINWFCSGSVI
jgi:hypothetical protein